MSSLPKVSVESNFTGGLKTEFTGLNFPENAATDTDNCIYTITGDVIRREGIDFETNFTLTTIDRTGKALSSYRWNNAGGDGTTQLYVEQVGSTLYFYKTSAATVASPLSAHKLTTTVTINSFLATGSGADPSITECTYADGNGYLFVFHPNLDPFYCQFDGTSVIANMIEVDIRDFNGVPEPAVPVNFRSTSLTNEHSYNLQNQGWTSAALWTAFSTTAIAGIQTFTAWGTTTGNKTFTTASGLTISAGQAVTFQCGGVVGLVIGGTDSTLISGIGTVVSYSGTTLVINISSVSTYTSPYQMNSDISQTWAIQASATVNLISTWNSAIGNYPSNADVWWDFKNASDVFAPSTTIGNVPQATTPAPKGHFVVPAFSQNFTLVSGVSSITSISTLVRPRTGAWFQGRVFYAGVDASQAATGDQAFYTWTEDIYFSQTIETATQFGHCYQTNDPTDQNLFDLLPSDGGVITIQGSGSIYRLFPIKNGMLVFAANGIWFLTGSQGIGFTANDYTVTKISGVQSISSTSFVNVNGLPMFWNEEGIYSVEPTQNELGLSVNPVTVGTILSFYADIPRDSKRFVRGDYNPIDYVVQWIYRGTQESSVTTRYQFDKFLNFNIYNKAFYPYSISGTPHVHAVTYISYPGGSTAPDPVFKYMCSYANAGSYKFTFAEENNASYIDWHAFDSTGVDYTSYFVTGYKLHGQALRQWQPEYVHVYSVVPSYYKIQGIWNYAKAGGSGKFSSIQSITNDSSTYGDFTIVMRRHRIRGHGVVFQIKVLSVTGQPFDINGWSIWEQINSGI